MKFWYETQFSRYVCLSSLTRYAPHMSRKTSQYRTIISYIESVEKVYIFHFILTKACDISIYEPLIYELSADSKLRLTSYGYYMLNSNNTNKYGPANC